MKTLKDVRPTPEQLRIISKNKPGVEIIRGAAGSGKTTTALLRLRSLIGIFLSRKRREGSGDPVKILVLTYNRTLRGYINELASQQLSNEETILTVETFSKWAVNNIKNVRIIDPDVREQKLNLLGREIELDNKFLLDEIEYVMGRFLPSNINAYLDARRDGRGISPRVEKPIRKKIVNDVIIPYQNYIDEKGLWDWNDLSVYLANQSCALYDIIIVDEAQDFSANQIRAINNHLKPNSSLTFVLDTAQRIYARCRVPDDQMSYRSYPLLAARELLHVGARVIDYAFPK